MYKVDKNLFVQLFIQHVSWAADEYAQGLAERMFKVITNMEIGVL